MATADGGMSAMSGIDLLMNPKKRSSSVSDAMSSISSAASDMSRARVVPARNAPHDATVGGMDDDDDVARHEDVEHYRSAPAPAPQLHRPRSPAHQQAPPQYRAVSVAASSSASTADDDDDEEEEEDDDDEEEEEEEEMTEAEVINRKREILYQLDRLEKKGVRMPRRYTMADPLHEMQAEMERLKLDREVDASIKFQRKLLMACVTGIEFLNNKFDPLDVRLDGWSDSINENLPEYDDVFEELYCKYRGKAKMAPELKLMFMIGGSGVMFHLTNSMFRSEAARPRGGGGGGGMGGGLFGMLGNMFGGAGGGSPMQAPQMQQQQQSPQMQQSQQSPQSPRGHMRGPVHMDEILRGLHNDAFPGGAPHHHAVASQSRSQRIEIVSNASDTDISELPDDTASLGGFVEPPAPPVKAVRGRGGRAPAASSRGGKRGGAKMAGDDR
jgi:hypothetical protein